MRSEPLNGPIKAFFKAYLRLPAQKISGLRIITHKPLNLALLRSHPLIFSQDIWIFTYNREYPLGNIPYGYIFTPTQIDGLTDRVFRFCHLTHSSHSIRHEGKIPRGMERTHYYFISI